MNEMPNHFDETVAALKDLAEGLNAVLAAREEYREREDSIGRLEVLVLQLSTEVRALRDRLDGPH